MSAFVDQAAICVKGGSGGAGAVAARREAHVPRGGPDGGDGGDGGSVWLVADHNVSSLISFRDHPHRTAEDGRHGSGKKRHGPSGDDLEVKVPVGTVVKDRDGAVLADLKADGDRWLAAEGGRGGRGNASFLSNRRRYPAFAEQGERTEERWLTLEIRLMADVALVGLPNVGKSTLISVVSAAKPKIADYPFTTLEPNLGVVVLDDGRDFVLADIPGLIEGASDGKGLGFTFLRHIDRARILVFLVDLAEWDGTSVGDQLAILEHELSAYRPDLAERPRLVVGARCDLVPDLASPPAGVDLVVSSVARIGLGELVGRLADLVDEHAGTPIGLATPVVHRPAPEGVVVGRDPAGVYVVTGRPAVRAVALSDLGDHDALQEMHRRLDTSGVNRALSAAGASDGDLVRIGDVEFEFVSGDDFLGL